MNESLDITVNLKMTNMRVEGYKNSDFTFRLDKQSNKLIKLLPINKEESTE